MNVTILDAHVMVCGECLQGIANDDYTHLDYSLKEVEAAAREAEIREAIVRFRRDNGGRLYAGNAAKDQEFSTVACECCGSRLAGARYHCVTLSA